ncbi:MAG: regulatory protein RecX [Arenicellales bacterium]
MARREHGISELSRKLVVKQFDPLLVDEAIQGLVRDNLVSDERFCESMINSRLNRGHGPIKVRYELRNKGVPEHVVEKTMEELSPDWHQSLAGLIEKKYAGQLSRTPAERVKQVRFLSSRGFPHEMIYSVIQDAEFD